MVRRHPIIHVYRSQEDLNQLKEWFFNFESKDNRFAAVQRVKALASRGKLPHVIEITSLLTSVVLQDDGRKLDTNLLQMSYSMALIRFVNGLLDPFQQSNFAIPLHQLAKKLNLPSFFVELRHMSTHESLPNLVMCRIATKRALNWLYDNYWESLDVDDYDDSDNSESDDEQISESDRIYIAKEVDKINQFIKQSNLLESLKTYKKIRKSNLDLVYKYGDNSPQSKPYWKCMKSIKNVTNTNIVISTLIFQNFMIYNADKIDSSKKNKFNSLLIKLYKPMLDELGPKFKLQLFQAILTAITCYYKPPQTIEGHISGKLGWTITDPFEVVEFLEWVKFLFSDILQYDQHDGKSRNDILGQLVDDFSRLYELVPQEKDVQSCFLKVLQSLQESFETKAMKNLIKSETKTRVSDWITNINTAIDVRASYDLPPSLDELLGDTTGSENQEVIKPAIKRQKVETKSYFFDEVPNWTPTAFGSWV